MWLACLQQHSEVGENWFPWPLKKCDYHHHQFREYPRGTGEAGAGRTENAPCLPSTTSEIFGTVREVFENVRNAGQRAQSRCLGPEKTAYEPAWAFWINPSAGMHSEVECLKKSLRAPFFFGTKNSKSNTTLLSQSPEPSHYLSWKVKLAPPATEWRGVPLRYALIRVERLTEQEKRVGHSHATQFEGPICPMWWIAALGETAGSFF